jgi:hypothetical protein
VGWLIFVAAIGAAVVSAYAIAGYIGRLGRWVLAVLAVMAVPALVSAGYSYEIQGYALVLAVAAAVGVSVGVLAYTVRHSGGRESPQQYLS